MESSEPSTKRNALVIGIDKYEHSPLLGCAKDATEMAECLALPQYAFDVNLLIDKSASRDRVMQALGELTYDGSGELLLIYFAGHGVALGNAGHLMLHDGTRWDPGIPLSALAQLMESASDRYSQVVLILDCCHSGAGHIATGTAPISKSHVEQGIPGVNASRALLAACGPAGTAKEREFNGSTRGEFSSALLEGMLGDSVDFDGNVTLMSLHDYVSKSIDSSLQTPVLKGDINGAIVLGSGFEPRLGAPLGKREQAETVAKAASLADRYLHTQQRELSESYNRSHGGLVRCSRILEDSLRWFEDTKRDIPDVTRDIDWKRSWDTLVNGQATLADFAVGDEVTFGRVVSRIGQGGFGNVWKIREPGGTELALKVFHGSEITDPLKPHRFRNGYFSMKGISHPRIVAVHHLAKAPLSFTMDYIDGPDLRSLYLDPQLPDETLQLIFKIADAVRFAHDSGVKHRDIKPENVVVENIDGVNMPSLTDFDLAYIETNRTVTTHLVGGVINYAAPEQFYSPNKAVARATAVDVYSMGQLMYFLITTRDPSPDDQVRNIATLAQATRDWVDSRAASKIVDLYRASTEWDPKNRIQSMETFVTKLSRISMMVEASQNSEFIERDIFCQRVANLYAGNGSWHELPDGVTFMSNSSTTSVVLRERGTTPREASIEMHLTVTRNMTLPGAKSQQEARTRINVKLDKKLAPFECERTHVSSPHFQTKVIFRKISLTPDGASLAVEALISAISAIENWG